MSAFFTLHRDLPREGPGVPEDVAWVASQARIAPGGRILDAACGPGADIDALLDAFDPQSVLGVDLQAHFVHAASTRFANDRRVTVRQGDMLDPNGAFDLIWCAGAIYFHGIAATLQAWDRALASGGRVAFSSPVYFTDAPSRATRAFWEGEGDTPTVASLHAQVAAAGFQIIAERPLSDAAWEAYYQPMEARVATLRPGADTDLTRVLDDAVHEAATWREVRHETGYHLCVVART